MGEKLSIHVRTLAAGLVLMLGLAACGLESSWSVSPVAWGEEVDGGVIVTRATSGETMEVGEDDETVTVYAHIEYFDIEEDMDGFVETDVTRVALTERTVCVLDGSTIDPKPFASELMDIQAREDRYRMKVKYLSGAATEVTLESQ